MAKIYMSLIFCVVSLSFLIQRLILLWKRPQNVGRSKHIDDIYITLANL